MSRTRGWRVVAVGFPGPAVSHGMGESLSTPRLPG